MFVEVGIVAFGLHVRKRFVNDRSRAAVLHRGGPYDVLQRAAARVHVETVVREYQTTDAWETGSWAPQTWTAPVSKARE